MEPQITRITREIPCRGIAYLIVRQCGAQALGEQLDREVRTMADLGAREIYAASTDPAAPLRRQRRGRCGSPMSTTCWRWSGCWRLAAHGPRGGSRPSR